MDLSGVSRPITAPVRVDRTGASGPTSSAARRNVWRKTSRGWYVPSHVDGSDLSQRIAEAAVILPARGGVTGWAALAWMGSRWFDGTSHGTDRLPVTLVTTPARVRPQPGIALSEERLAPDEVVAHDGIRITVPARSVCFEARYAYDLVGAVTWIDMAAYDDHVSLAEVHAYATPGLNGWTGVPQLRAALDLADENAWSPPEVGMRMLWILEAGRDRPLCNRPIFSLGGGHLGTPDLFDPVAGVVGEYEGGLHLEGVRRAKDLDRESLFRSCGLEYVTMVAADRHDPSRFLKRLRTAYDSATRSTGRARPWTLQPPPWWRDTSTVAARRALDDIDRLRWLRHRAA